MSVRRRWRPLLAALLLVAAPLGSLAQDSKETPRPAPENSVMDDRLFYQLLIGEMALAQGDAGTAYDWLLDAARRTKDDGLFRRAVNIAMQARAGEQALAAARAWRLARPDSLEALRLQLQILLALGRAPQLNEPLRSLLEQTPANERSGLIAALPRFLHRANDAVLVAVLMDDVLKPYRDRSDTRVVARVAQGRAWLDAKEYDQALAQAQDAHALEPAAPGPAFLALELMRERPRAEATVLAQLRLPQTDPGLRMSYVRVLTASQRFAEAIVQLETLTQNNPQLASPFLSLGALHLELKHPKKAEAALLRFVELAQMPAAAAAAPLLADDGQDDAPARADQGLTQAWLMLAQLSEQAGQYAVAESWLARIDDPQRRLEVQSRRASMLSRQGKVSEARALIRNLPEKSPDDARAKLMAEAAVLRESKRWKEAFDLLAGAAASRASDTDLLYEQAMMAEKLNRIDDMERLLRRVIEIKPDNAHAHNALGYSLADRRMRLPEARQLVQRALELAPGDPFITDSLGWIEYRMGNGTEALRLLRQAYAARPDTEIGAHLGEVLWTLGQRDEARRIWRESQGRDAGNDVLKETLARLRVDL